MELNIPEKVYNRFYVDFFRRVNKHSFLFQKNGNDQLFFIVSDDKGKPKYKVKNIL